MVGVPQCWNCGNVDTWSSARRIWCRRCDAYLWKNIYPGRKDFKSGSQKK